MDQPGTEAAESETLASRHLEDPVREVDLRAAAEAAWAALDRTAPGHTARTLVKRPGLRVVLLVLRRDALIPEHTAEGDLTLHVLSGRVGVRVQREERQLEAGQLLAIEKLVEHSIRAHLDSEVLLSLAWPP